MAFAVAFLSSCTVAVEEERPRPPRPDRPQFCTQQYEPVCAARGDRRRTFGNACMAQAEGFRPVHPGECRQSSPDRPPNGGRPPQACTREYAPVCARRDGRSRTFGNACTARAAGFRPVHPGECRQSSPGRPPDGGRPPQACTREYAPVCARRGDRVRTFGNACEARAAEYRLIRPGEC
ncbi:Kazal-type serine protease inhibitor domain-containing protein [Chelativorans sp. M5D2P16]|nr:Kazal-type serine protease inhibitor domain-containing protein [Chelativorans sp. M5D2P16]MDZ5700158.1 Kazal-type serine protease inhibitor domain-containing protein [Chelativorans sp. M5D2P16]